MTSIRLGYGYRVCITDTGTDTIAERACLFCVTSFYKYKNTKYEKPKVNKCKNAKIQKKPKSRKYKTKNKNTKKGYIGLKKFSCLGGQHKLSSVGKLV